MNSMKLSIYESFQIMKQFRRRAKWNELHRTSIENCRYRWTWRCCAYHTYTKTLTVRVIGTFHKQNHFPLTNTGAIHARTYPIYCVQMYFESTSLCQIIQAFSTSMFPLDWWTLESRWNAHNSCEFSFHFRNMLCVYWWNQVEMWCSCNGLASPTPASTVGFLRILQLGATRGKE